VRSYKNKNLIISFSILLFLVSLFFGSKTFGQVSQKLDISAYVVDGSNKDLQNGEYEIKFAIYGSETGGQAVWQETQKIQIINGIMDASLGSVTPLPITLTFNDKQYYLGIAIGSDNEMTPRKKIGSVPNAVNSQFLRGATIGNAQGDILQLGSGGKINVSNLPTGTGSSSLVLGNDNRLHTQNSDTGTDSLVFVFGQGSSVGGKNFDLAISAATSQPALRFNGTTGKWQFSNEGNTFSNIAADFAGIWDFSRGGTGTSTKFSQGSIVFAGADGIYSEDNANFFWNSGSKRLGIGTNNPGYLLDVNGNANFNGEITANSLTINGQAKLGTSGQNVTINSNLIPSVAGLNLGSADNHWANIFVDNMTVGGTNVNGTTSEFFAINTGATGETNMGLRFYKGATNDYATLFWDATAHDFKLYRREDTSLLGNLTVDTITANNISGNIGGGDITPDGFVAGPVVFGGTSGILSQDNNLFWDNTNKNLGIGTAAPLSKLSIQGTGSETKFINVSDDIGNLFRVERGTYSLNVGGSQAGGSVGAFWSGVTSGSALSFNIAVNSTAAGVNTGTNVALYGYASGATNNFGLYVENGKSYFAQNVGIGTKTPTSLLSVGATSQFQVNSSGQIAAAAGITSSGIITFSGLNTAGIVTNTAAGVLGTVSTLGVTLGGTGTTTQFTPGSIVFSGASGFYSQDNANFFWDNTNKNLGIGINTPSNMLTVGTYNSATSASGFKQSLFSTDNMQLSQLEGGAYFGRVGIKEQQLGINNYGNTWVAKDSNRNWYGIAVSSDGKVQTAVVSSGQIYVSTDYGNTWTAKDSSRNWINIAMSSEGKIQTAVVNGGQIYVSTDYGNTWTAKGSSLAWYGIAISSDGKIQTATVTNGQLYISTDYGNTWTAKDSARNWRGVAMSSDGKIQTALDIAPGNIYISTNYGNTWIAKDSARSWYGIAMSSDGKIQTAVVSSGQIYISIDYGNNWIAKDSARSWYRVAMNSDGKIQTATVTNGQIYISIDYGNNWIVKDSSRSWQGIAMSSDGKIQTAVVQSGQIYVSHADSYLPGGNFGVGTATPTSLLSVGATSQFQVNSSGQIAAIAGYSQTSGNFAMSGTGTFATGTGTVSLNGATTIAANQNFSMASGTGTFLQTYTGVATANTITANSLTSGNILSLTSTSTAAAAGNTGLNIAISGANGTAAITRYGLQSAVTATNVTSGTNIAGYFSASGATTANYGLIVANGNTGLGIINPSNMLTVGVYNSAVSSTFKQSLLSVDNMQLSSLEGGAYFGRVGIKEQQLGLNNYGNTWVAKDSSRSWSSIAMSSDGKIQTAVDSNPGFIYVSTDYGNNWTAKDSSRSWIWVAMSSDGKIQTAPVLNGQIYVSTDYGNTWTAKDSSRSWYGNAMSSDGKIQAAFIATGQIYISNDYGNTWTTKGNSLDYKSIAMSSDGKIQTAVTTSNFIYVSIDYGNTWSAKDSSRQWYGVAMSSDGKIQTAAPNAGQIYVSTDYGNTWSGKDFSRNWYRISMSSDGKIQTALADKIYVSIDYGNTWTSKDSSRAWQSIAMNSDGKIQTAVVSGGQIYVSIADSYLPSGNFGIGTAAPTSMLSVGATSQFQVNSTGAIAAATGVTSSGNITFSGLNTAGIVTNTAAGVLGTVAAIPAANGGTGLNTSGSTGVPSISLGTWSVASSLGVTLGGTGTTTQFTQGSMVFAGASGVYTQDNANLFYDSTNHRLGLGTISPNAMLDLYGVNNALRLSYDASNYSTISAASNGVLQFSTTSGSFSDSAVLVGNNTAQNVSVIYDNLTQDYYSGVDNSDSVFKIGSGQNIGTTPILSIKASNGFAGIGNIAPGTLLHVGSASTTTGNQITIQDNDGTCTLNPASGASWSCTSDRNMKYDIANLTGSLDKVMQLNPTTFKMKVNGSNGVGFIAQEVQTIIPEAVRLLPDGNLGLDAARFIPYIVGSVKEQEGKIDAMALSSLEQKVDIENLKLKTTENVTTVFGLQTSVDQQLNIVGASIETLGEKIVSIENFDLAQKDINLSLQNQVDELKKIADPTNLQLALAQIDLNSAEIGYIKTILGITDTNLADVNISGKLTAKIVNGGALEIFVSSQDSRTIGTAVFPVADADGNDGKSVKILTKNITDKSKVFVSFQGNPGSANWVEKEKDSDGKYVGFKIMLSDTVANEIKVDWWIVEEK
jgi:hypothetical protein